uniref:Coiled-coil-helix-coiled-coil-helix domain containing 6 n=1 Tax=Ficedula albicollis TaxID=59894 RepID=A0A803WC83_FICAL
MGSSASSHGGRRVSFGLDEREQIRVLQGIRLTEDVVNRMRGCSVRKRDIHPSPRASDGTAPSSLAAGVKPKPTGIQPPKAGDSAAEHELYRRYVEEQALVQEELLWLAKKEREAACEAKQRNSIIEERQKTAQVSLSSPLPDSEKMAMQLQVREAELKLQEDFYKEQLARIEKKNAEIYKMTTEQYQEAATKAEERIKSRHADPVCVNLQSEILKCFRENKNEVLNCSELAKEYQRCVSAAQKVWIHLIFGPTSQVCRRISSVALNCSTSL